MTKVTECHFAPERIIPVRCRAGQLSPSHQPEGTMIREACWRFTVYYAEGPSRDVTAYSRAGAARTGRRAAQLVGLTGKACKVVRVEPRWEVGTPVNAGLFGPTLPRDETPEAMKEER